MGFIWDLYGIYDLYRVYILSIMVNIWLILMVIINGYDDGFHDVELNILVAG